MSSSSKATKRDTSSKANKAPDSGLSASSANANTPNDTTDPAIQTSSSTARPAQTHEQQASADGPRRKSTDSDLTTWAHLSLDRSGATVHTICTRDHEDGETCTQTAREHWYRHIPRVDGPSEKITVKGVEAMMQRDGRAERESDGEGDEGWVVVDRD